MTIGPAGALSATDKGSRASSKNFARSRSHSLALSETSGDQQEEKETVQSLTVQRMTS